MEKTRAKKLSTTSTILKQSPKKVIEMTSHLPLNFFYQLPYFLFTSEDPLLAFIRKYLLML